MISVSASVDIERTPEEVWDFLMDPAKAAVWERAVVSSRRLGDGPVGSGARYRKTVGMLGKRFDVDLEITDYRPARHASVVITNGPIAGGGSYSVAPISSGTRLTYGLRHQPRGLLRIAEPILRPAYPRLLRRDLETLKLAVETARRPAPDRRN